MVQPGCSIVQTCSSSLLMLGKNVAVDFLSGRLSVDGSTVDEEDPSSQEVEDAMLEVRKSLAKYTNQCGLRRTLSQSTGFACRTSSAQVSSLPSAAH